MSEPEKPFACVIPDCGMTFTNEDHLNVHTKKHDMVLQLALGQKGVAFVADQTPTPTRFIRNCEEVGLFQDLQNVNPFDETFKRAMDTRVCSNSLEPAGSGQGDDVLHTPHIFPHLSEGSPSAGFSSSGQKSTEETDTSCLTTDSSVETSKDKDCQIFIEKSTKDVCTVTTAQKHNLAIKKGLLTHRVDASLQMPVISISESDDSPVSVNLVKMRYAYPYTSKLAKDDILLASSTRLNSESLHPPTPEEHTVQLISQKSIEQALDNLARGETKEQHQQQPPQQQPLMEKRNLFAAQKIAEITNVIVTNNNAHLKSVTETSAVGDSRLKRQNPYVIETVKNNHEVQAQKINVMRSNNWIEDGSGRNSLANGDSTDNGYELLLKLPNGKKVFLKEANRVVKSPEKPKSPKEVLKEAIAKCKLKKATLQQNTIVKQDKIPIPANPNVLVFPPNARLIQGLLGTETIAKAQVLSITKPTKETKRLKKSAKVVEEKKEPKPKKIVEKVKDNEKELHHTKDKDKEREKEKRRQSPSPEPKTTKIEDKDRSAMAMAGRRYRRRKKETHAMLLEHNRKLQLDNEAMSRQLISYMIEIKRLRDIVNVHRTNATTRAHAAKYSHVRQGSPKLFWMSDLDANRNTTLNSIHKSPDK